MGHIASRGNDSAWNTGNPLVPEQASYYLYSIRGDVTGPLAKNASYFFSIYYFKQQNQSIVDAINPDYTATKINEAIPNPSSFLLATPRVDFQLGKRHTVSIRDSFYRSVETASGVGSGLNLPEQAYSVDNMENAIQVSDTVVASSRVINETHFQWRRIRNGQTANYFTPTVTVQGAFTTGGNNSGVVKDHQDVFELQNYTTAIAGNQTIRYGARARVYRDANYSTSGANGKYLFESIPQYLARTPSQYQATVVTNPLARVLLFDGALFYQDDWRWKPNLTLSYGLRFESQNRIRDHSDWAPRLALAWAPGAVGKTPPKTVLRAGYGWFYNRFTVPNSFSSANGAPYIVQAIHLNGINQQSYVINNPGFYNPNAPITVGDLNAGDAPIPYYYSVDRHFHAALDMQGGVGVDRQITKKITLNATYLFTRGVHQYLSNNVTAPEFDPSTYTVVGALPATSNYQFQSAGVYKQHQLILTASSQYRHFSVRGWYTFNEAKSDTQGVTYFPSVAQDPGLDYGRASFGVRNRLFLLGSYAAPHGFTVAPILATQSGTPYNLTIGSDLTKNNQFNARPTYGSCGGTGVLSTPYGCLDSGPIGKGEKIVPYSVATGPANVVFHIRVSKVFGVGRRAEDASGTTGTQSNGDVSSNGLSGGQAKPKLDAAVSRKYRFTIVAGAWNLFNIVNLGTPNGTLTSPLFGQTQTLAAGLFSSPTAGNRMVFLQASFGF